jgi:methanol metabolism-related c-type cytochrome
MALRRWFVFPLAAALVVLASLPIDSRAQQVSDSSSAGSSATGQNSNAQAAADLKPYKIAKDGTVDWATFSGYLRFNSICETCHGFDGEGSSFGPRLVDSLKTMSHDNFLEIVTNGKQDVNTAQTLKMPGFGTNPNVMCYIDDIYAYLKARADGVVGRGRPAKHEPKPQAATDAENSCMGPD